MTIISTKQNDRIIIYKQFYIYSGVNLKIKKYIMQFESKIKLNNMLKSISPKKKIFQIRKIDILQYFLFLQKMNCKKLDYSASIRNTIW